MTSLRKTRYPSLDLCELCLWTKERYIINNFEYQKYKNETSTKLENKSDLVKGKICLMCGIELPDERKLKEKKYIFNKSENAAVSRDNIYKSKLLLIIVTVVTATVLWILFGPSFDLNSKVSENKLNTELQKLMQKYPNQNQELWYNILKITNATKPLVHVLILLHKGNSEVAECFAKDLISLINKIINKDGFLIYKENSEATEYGLELNHYLKLVGKHNHLIVFQLNKISGNTARMFHALCDDAPSSIRPSFFIFTVEDETKETNKVRRPLARAGHILRTAWSNLMENELHPLISRVVRNVAEILPENTTC